MKKPTVTLANARDSANFARNCERDAFKKLLERSPTRAKGLAETANTAWAASCFYSLRWLLQR